MKINEELIEKEIFSTDETGSIFFYEGKVLRGINRESIGRIKDIFECGLMDELVKNNLFPRTTITEYKSSKYELIIEHEKLESISYCFEWSFNMIRDAALLVLKVESIANKYGYHLKDPHAYNVVFVLNNPVYIDLGSLLEENTDLIWTGKTDFIYSFYIPLQLMTKGFFELGRMLMYQYKYLTPNEYLILTYPITYFLPYKYRKAIILLKSITTKNNNSIDNKIKVPILKSMAKKTRDYINEYFNKNYVNKKIMRMKDNNKPLTMWENYHDDIHPHTNPRMKYIGNLVLGMEDIKSCLEIGANQGAFSKYILSVSDISRLIAVDYDEGAVDRMYLNNSSEQRIQTVLANPFIPDISNYHAEFSERFKSDLVIIMAVTHHLILSQNINIDHILKKMSELTNKYLIIEFMPLGLYHGDDEDIPPLPIYYNKEWFSNNLKSYFLIKSECHIEKNRIVYSCQKYS